MRCLIPIFLLFLLTSCHGVTSAGGSSSVPKNTPSAKEDISTDAPRGYKPRKEGCEKYYPLVESIAAEFELETELVLGVMKVESGFNPGTRSRVGAQGLMQIMPKTGKYFECGSDIWDPETNIRCGCKVLKSYFAKFDGNLVYGLSAYNTGPGRTVKYSKQWHLPANFAYVEKVLRWRNVFVRFGCR